MRRPAGSEENGEGGEAMASGPGGKAKDGSLLCSGQQPQRQEAPPCSQRTRAGSLCTHGIPKYTPALELE